MSGERIMALLHLEKSLKGNKRFGGVGAIFVLFAFWLFCVDLVLVSLSCAAFSLSANNGNVNEMAEVLQAFLGRQLLDPFRTKSKSSRLETDFVKRLGTRTPFVMFQHILLATRMRKRDMVLENDC